MLATACLSVNVRIYCTAPALAYLKLAPIIRGCDEDCYMGLFKHCCGHIFMEGDTGCATGVDIFSVPFTSVVLLHQTYTTSLN